MAFHTPESADLYAIKAAINARFSLVALAVQMAPSMSTLLEIMLAIFRIHILTKLQSQEKHQAA